MRLLVVIAVCAVGCSSTVRPPAPSLLSTVAVGSARGNAQLLSGFYDVEETWRWVGGRFVVKLAVPADAEWRAELAVDGFYPDVLLRHHAQAILQCAVDDAALAPLVLDKAGFVHLGRALPAMHGETALVSCTVSPTLQPENDARELGMVVSLVGLRAH